MDAVEPGPRRTQPDGAKITFHSNPGPIIDARAIEYELHRPTMGAGDRRNKDVVPFHPAISAMFGSNNCTVPLTVRRNSLHRI